MSRKAQPPAKILIIDDDPLICDWVAAVVRQIGHAPVSTQTLAEGIKKARAESFEVVFLDAQLPEGSGLDLMPKIKATRSSPEIIVLTGFGDPDEAERAVVNGAWDYIEKPASVEAIRLPLVRALEYRAEKAAGKPPLALNRNGIIGHSQRLNASLDLLAQAAGSDVNVLITGETGTGKELFAKAIHQNSSRADKNFVIVDCTALPETLVESVLFGHARGAFTGADRRQDGLIKQADKGTLFLDEIGELPPAVQKRFLRVIQEHRFRPVGGDREVKSDFRLIAATNRELEGMVRQGRFREDLLFRLRTLVIELTPLRESLEDVKELTVFYMKALCDRFGIVPKGFSPEFWNVVIAYQWPGNVRELIQALEKALLSAKDEPMLFPKHLPTHIRIQVARNIYPKRLVGLERPEASPSPPPVLPKWKEFRGAAFAEAEGQYLREVLRRAGGNIPKTCRISGLSRSRLYTLLKKHRLVKSR